MRILYWEMEWHWGGGKLEVGETPLIVAIKEAREEIELDLDEYLILEAGVLNFYYLDKPKRNRYVYIFLAKGWNLESVETEEIKSAW